MKEHFAFWVGGLHVHVEGGGSGKPLLLLHGLGGPVMWQKVAPLLEKTFTVYRVHLPGFGYSSKPAVEYTIPFFMDILHKTVLSIGVRPFTLGGISMGGQIAVEYAAANPAFVQKLILIGSTGVTCPAPWLRNIVAWRLFSPVLEGFLLKHKAPVCFSARRSFYDLSSRPEGLCDKAFYFLNQPGGTGAWVRAFHAVISENTRNFVATLETLNIPSLIVWGMNDRVMPVRSAHLFRQSLKGSKLVTFENCGHSVPLEKPQDLAEVITHFVEIE